MDEACSQHTEEIRSALGGSTSGLLIVSKSKQDVNDAALFMDAYGVTAEGNFEGKNILYRARDTDVLAEMHRMSVDEVERKLESARQKLFAARERRVKPARDEKILTGWNGLILAAFAEAARVLKREDYRQVAVRDADFLLGNLRDENGRPKRSYKDGQARLNGYLEDNANLAEGLLALYETTFDVKYFSAARELANQILEICRFRYWGTVRRLAAGRRRMCVGVRFFAPLAQEKPALQKFCVPDAGDGRGGIA